MSSRDEITKTLAEHRQELSGLGVKRLALFGSAAREQDSPESDVDFLVRFSAPSTFDLYMNLKFWLEDLIGRPVDLVTEKALRPELRASVERDAIRVT